jgi:hypothetical protein
MKALFSHSIPVAVTAGWLLPFTPFSNFLQGSSMRCEQIDSSP